MGIDKAVRRQEHFPLGPVVNMDPLFFIREIEDYENGLAFMLPVVSEHPVMPLQYWFPRAAVKGRLFLPHGDQGPVEIEEGIRVQ